MGAAGAGIADVPGVLCSRAGGDGITASKHHQHHVLFLESSRSQSPSSSNLPNPHALPKPKSHPSPTRAPGFRRWLRGFSYHSRTVMTSLSRNSPPGPRAWLDWDPLLGDLEVGYLCTLTSTQRTGRALSGDELGKRPARGGPPLRAERGCGDRGLRCCCGVRGDKRAGFELKGPIATSISDGRAFKRPPNYKLPYHLLPQLWLYRIHPLETTLCPSPRRPPPVNNVPTRHPAGYLAAYLAQLVSLSPTLTQFLAPCGPSLRSIKSSSKEREVCLAAWRGLVGEADLKSRTWESLFRALGARERASSIIC